MNNGPTKFLLLDGLRRVKEIVEEMPAGTDAMIEIDAGSAVINLCGPRARAAYEEAEGESRETVEGDSVRHVKRTGSVVVMWTETPERGCR